MIGANISTPSGHGRPRRRPLEQNPSLSRGYPQEQNEQATDGKVHTACQLYLLYAVSGPGSVLNHCMLPCGFLPYSMY